MCQLVGMQPSVLIWLILTIVCKYSFASNEVHYRGIFAPEKRQGIPPPPPYRPVNKTRELMAAFKKLDDCLDNFRILPRQACEISKIFTEVTRLRDFYQFPHGEPLFDVVFYSVNVTLAERTVVANVQCFNTSCFESTCACQFIENSCTKPESQDKNINCTLDFDNFILSFPPPNEDHLNEDRFAIAQFLFEECLNNFRIPVHQHCDEDASDRAAKILVERATANGLGSISLEELIQNAHLNCIKPSACEDSICDCLGACQPLPTNTSATCEELHQRFLETAEKAGLFVWGTSPGMQNLTTGPETGTPEMSTERAAGLILHMGIFCFSAIIILAQ